MTVCRWLLLCSPEYRFRAFLSLEKAGHVTLNPPPMEPAFGRARGGQSRAMKSAAENAERPRVVVPELAVVPQAVLVDHNVTKFRFMLAGFWRGYGVPVVYVRHPAVDNWSDMERLASALGMFSVRDLNHFSAWLAGPCHYLALAPAEPGRPLDPERNAALAELNRSTSDEATRR